MEGQPAEAGGPRPARGLLLCGSGAPARSGIVTLRARCNSGAEWVARSRGHGHPKSLNKGVASSGLLLKMYFWTPEPYKYTTRLGNVADRQQRFECAVLL